MNSQLIMQPQYKAQTITDTSSNQRERSQTDWHTSSSHSGLNKQHKQFNRGCPLLLHTNLVREFNKRSEMDFILPSTLPVSGIPWEKVLPPLIPRLNGTYGQYNWSQNLLVPETDNNSSAEVTCDDSGFTVQVDVKLFNPEDLLVKVIGDFVEVQGKHEEKKKDGPGSTTLQFNRRYRIPKGVDTMALESAVSPEGIIFISAPMLQTENSGSLTQAN